MRATKQMIQSFFEPKKIAVAGVSRSTKKFGGAVYKELTEKGFEVIPVNPNTDSLYGVTCFPSVSALPSGIESLLIVTSKKQTLEVLKEAVSKGIRNIWIQQMSETTDTVEYMQSNNLSVIMKECILMHSEPVSSIHKFHRTIKKIFGRLPK
jgi:uncharacterized protein